MRGSNLGGTRDLHPGKILEMGETRSRAVDGSEHGVRGTSSMRLLSERDQSIYLLSVLTRKSAPIRKNELSVYDSGACRLRECSHMLPVRNERGGLDFLT